MNMNYYILNAINYMLYYSASLSTRPVLMRTLWYFTPTIPQPGTSCSSTPPQGPMEST